MHDFNRLSARQLLDAFADIGYIVDRAGRILA